MRQGGLVGTVVGAVLCCAALAGCAGAGAPEPRTPMTQRATATATETETPRAAPSDDASGTSGTGSETVTLQPVEVVAPPAATQGDSAPVAAARCIDSQLMLEYRARPQDSGAGSFYGRPRLHERRGDRLLIRRLAGGDRAECRRCAARHCGPQ